MFHRKLRALCLPWAAAATLAMPLAAQATATSTFYGLDLSQVFDKAYSSFSTTVNGIGLTIQAVSSGSDPKVTVRWDGIGMRRDFLESGDLNSGIGHAGDVLLLSFSQDVRIHSIVLSGWDTLLGAPIDQASVTTQGSDFKLTGGLTPFLSPLTTFNTSELLPAGRFYTLDATGSLSAFRLAGLSVTAVPELSSGAMLALGLGGIAMLRRRRAD
jgi:MYXO-CTERM domain-containing protein